MKEKSYSISESEINDVLETYLTSEDLTDVLRPYLNETEINDLLEDYLTEDGGEEVLAVMEKEQDADIDIAGTLG